MPKRIKKVQKKGTSETVNTNNLVVKSNKLLELSYKLKTTEKKLILLAASNIRPDDINFRVLKFQVKDVITLLNLKGESAYNHLQEITKELLSKVIVDERTDEESGKLKKTQTHWFSSCSYIPNDGIIELRLSEEMLPYFLQLKSDYTKSIAFGTIFAYII